jgi:hypothetical protein
MRLFLIPIVDPQALTENGLVGTEADADALALFTKSLHAFLKGFNFPPIYFGIQAQHVDWIMVNNSEIELVWNSLKYDFGERLKSEDIHEFIRALSERKAVGISVRTLGTFSIFWCNSSEIVMTIGSSDEYWVEHGFKSLKFAPIERTSDLTKTDWFDLYP